MSRPRYSPLLTAAEVAELLHVTVDTVYAYVRRGLLAAIRPPGPNRKWMRFRACDVEAFTGCPLERAR